MNKIKHCTTAIKSILYFVCATHFIFARIETGGDVRSFQNRCLSIPTHSFVLFFAWFWNVLAFLCTFTTALKMAIIDCENQSLLHLQCALFLKYSNTFVFLCMLACFWFHWKPTCLLSVVLLTNSSDSFHTKRDLWSICAIGIHTRFIRWNRVCFI